MDPYESPTSRALWYGLAVDALLRLPENRRVYHLAHIAQSIRTVDNFTACRQCPGDCTCHVWEQVAVMSAALVY